MAQVNFLRVMYQNWVTLGYRFPPGPPSEQQWADCNGGENDEKNNGKIEALKQWEKNGKFE